MAPLRSFLAIGAICVLLAPARDSVAQCILSNPSFELGGSGGQVFGGWNQFGNVGVTSESTHGADAARVTGPNTGNWDVSGYWQRFDSSPGDQWTATVRASHPSSKPLTGQCAAILNIEWRDGGGNLISYESHTVADAATPTDTYVDFAVTSGPAPVGTAAAHFLIGVLQSPTDPAPDVYFDEATFFNVGPPSIDDQQWNDFPGGRTINFGGYTWRVKGPGYYGPGPDLFSDSPSHVWVDVDDRLHMTIRNVSGAWYSTEVTLEDALGYGDYIFTTRGQLDALHQNTVLGLFIWQYGPCWDYSYLWWNPFNEIDVEISRWGNPSNDVAQFVAQPYDFPGNIDRFAVSFGPDQLTSFAFQWLPDKVEYRSWVGGPNDESPGNMIHTWTYTGPHIPRPEQPRVHINLWQFEAPPGTDQEVVLDTFTFVPEDGPASTVRPVAAATEPNARLGLARPNPFNPTTTIAYSLALAGDAELVVYDVTGRRVRTLVDGFVTAGDHEVRWDGRDDGGEVVSSGVYFYRLRAGDVVETQRMVLLK